MTHPPGPPCAGLLLNLLPSWGVVRHAVHRRTTDHVYRVNRSDIQGKEMIQTLTCAFFPEGVPQQGLQPVRTGLQNIIGFVPKNESRQWVSMRQTRNFAELLSSAHEKLQVNEMPWAHQCLKYSMSPLMSFASHKLNTQWLLDLSVQSFTLFSSPRHSFFSFLRFILSCCSVQAQQLQGSGLVALQHAGSQLPDQGSNSCPPH